MQRAIYNSQVWLDPSESPQPKCILMHACIQRMHKAPSLAACVSLSGFLHVDMQAQRVRPRYLPCVEISSSKAVRCPVLCSSRPLSGNSKAYLLAAARECLYRLCTWSPRERHTRACMHVDGQLERQTEATNTFIPHLNVATSCERVCFGACMHAHAAWSQVAVEAALPSLELPVRLSQEGPPAFAPSLAASEGGKPVVHGELSLHSSSSSSSSSSYTTDNCCCCCSRHAHARR